MRVRSLALLGLCLCVLPMVAHASVTLYSQPDDSGQMTDPQPTFTTASIESDSLDDLYLGKGPVTLTFTMQDPNASNIYGQPQGVALGSCAGCTDLQSYSFTDADRTLLADGQFHTFSVTTGSTAIGLADGTNPVYLTFFNLSQFQHQTVVKANAAGTLPAVSIEADDAPPPITQPALPADATALYAQADSSGAMANEQPTNLAGYIDSASLGDLDLGQGPPYLIFSLQDPDVGVTAGAPAGVCLEPAGSTGCGDALQTYYFTDADRALLADKASHAFLVETGTTTSAYADGSAPVALGFFGLSQVKGGTRVKADAGGTLPAVTIAYAGPPPPAKTSSVLFIPGTEASRLYMRAADGSDRRVWEPASASDVPLLAMNPDGSSAHEIFTKDIIGAISIDGSAALAHVDASDFELYGDFERFMDSLVASSTLGMREWRSYPYDWRYDVRDIAANGTLAEGADGSISRVYLEDMLDQMASSSATGKVTIVAHSNGGLLAKALLEKLAAEGKAGEVDQLVMIGTPQWGTPSDIGPMLHGDGYSLPSAGIPLIMYGGDVRTAAATMPGAYGMLPSPAYFAHVHDPVAVFNGGALSSGFKSAWPHGVTSFSDLVAFLTDGLGLDTGAGGASLLNTPLALDAGLISKAEATHAALDAWAPPAGLKVTAIAGWGEPTTFSYSYETSPGHTVCDAILGESICRRNELLVHVPVKTEDGDGTVVAPSAVGVTGDRWYFNTERYGKDGHAYFVHQDLTSAPPVQNALVDLIQNHPISEDYMVSSKPVAEREPLTIIAGKSPVNIVVTDAAGEEAGIVPIPGTGLYFAVEDIPGSSVDVSGDEKFVALPAGAPYSVSIAGYAAGPANVEIEQVDADGSTTSDTTLADIPVTAASTGSFSLDEAGAASPLSLDLDGDGAAEASMTPVADALTPYTPAESDATDSSSGAGGASGSTGVVSSGSAAPASAPAALAPATTTAASTTPAAASTTPVAPASRIAPADASDAAQGAAEPTAAAPATPQTSPAASAETAAAYAGLSRAVSSDVIYPVYHWIVRELRLLIHIIARLV
ncbi:MAG: hypothetical protein KGI03_03540 [Patescibacteria group bacterium]|nr:hypothetical protein [Patescibacteria group bacterium]